MESFDMGAQRLQSEKVSETLNFQDTEKTYATTVDKFRPMQDYVVILIPKIDKKTSSGIMKSHRQVEEELAKLPQVFEVVAVGPDIDNSRVSVGASETHFGGNAKVKVGQYVLCKRVESVPVQSLNEKSEVAVVRMFDIIGVFDSI